jgi:hypothetical protein
MSGYLEFNYISPISDHKFKKDVLHILVVSTINNNKIKLYKTIIKNIDNLDDQVIGYPINKSIICDSSQFNVKLFSFDKLTNKINLLFFGSIQSDDFEYGNMNYIQLIKSTNSDISIDYEDNSDFMNDIFFKNNDSNNVSKNRVYLYIGKVKTIIKPIMKPTEIDYDNKELKKELWYYDRYSAHTVKEYIPLKLEKMSKVNLIKNYEKYFMNNQQKINNKILKLDDRPLIFEQYSNNTVSSPVDGKLIGFRITDNLKLAIGDLIYGMKSLVSLPDQFIGGSGLKCRVSASDYQRVHMPYSGYIKEIGVFKQRNGSNLVSMRFESSYFIPSTVHERDLLSVVNGHFTYGGVGGGAGNRAYPELLLPQPKTYLIFNIVIMTPNTFTFTNTKLLRHPLVSRESESLHSEGRKDSKESEPIGDNPFRGNLALLEQASGQNKNIINNKNVKVKSYWYEQGEELGKLLNGFGTVLFLVNRPMEFTADIEHNSKINPESYSKTVIETYVKTRDIVATLN